MTDQRQHSREFLLVATVLSIGIFISDLFTPLGIADGVSYIAVVLLSLWMSSRSHTLWFAVAVSILTMAGMFFSSEGEAASVYITNRILSLMGIWTAAFLILKFRTSEAAAERNHQKLLALFNHATEGIILTNPDGKMLMVNPQAEKQFGYEQGQMNDHGLDWLFNSTQLKQQIEPLNRNVTLKEAELEGRKRSGEFFPAEIRLSSFKMDGEQHYVIFINDITERKRQHAALLRSNEELKRYAASLKETNAELENFAYISSHDLQEPLRKIQSFGDRLKIREAGQLSDDGKAYVDRMLNAAARMQRLIDDLLAFSRLTSRARSFENINLNVIVEEVLSDMEVSIERSGAEIQVQSALPVVKGDSTQMRQLFQNLLVNAIKFSKENEKPSIRIYCRSFDKEGEGTLRQFVSITVEDNGIGFKEKYREKIFGIFQRLEAKKYQGSGIGLAICRKIVKRHGGDIQAYSEEGAGSRFEIILPLEEKLQSA